MDKSFKLEILTPEREFYSDTCESLVVTTSHGEMGILKNTMPLVANLIDGGIKILQNEKWMNAFTGTGFIEVKPDGVVVLVQSAEWPFEIKEKSALEEVGRLSDQLKKQQSLREYKMAKAQLARQLARLKIKRNMLD